MRVRAAFGTSRLPDSHSLRACSGLLCVGCACLLLLVGPGEANAGSVTNGTVVGWGSDYWGQVSGTTGLTDLVAVAVGYSHDLAVRRDGSVVAWGDFSYYTNSSQHITNIPPGLSNIVAVAAGLSFSLALRQDGTVVAWGDNTYGQVSVPSGLTGVVAVAAGQSHSVALKQDGTVACWGSMTSPPVNLAAVVAVTAGHHHDLALKADGTVVGWGYSPAGEATPPAGLTGVAAIAAGDGFSIAALTNGSLVAWGRNPPPVPEGLSNVVALSAGGSFVLALKRDSTVWAWGYGRDQTNVPFGLSNVVAISAGSSHALALVSNPPDPPMVTEDPQDQVVKVGLDATLSALGWGTSPLGYRWLKGEDEIPGATNQVLVLPNAAASTAGRYRAVVTNPYGTATSHLATITVQPDPPRGTSVVNNNADSGPGALRQALFDANAVGGGTILFSGVTGTLRLGSALPAVRGDMTIIGPGSNSLALSGFGFSSTLSVARGATCTVSGLSFYGFSAADYANGAALSNAGSLHVADCAFVNNLTHGFGGAIYNEGDLVLENSSFGGNTVGPADSGPKGSRAGPGGGGAGLGGALYTTNGSVSIWNCALVGNQAIGGTYGGSSFSGTGPFFPGGRGGGLTGGAGGVSTNRLDGLNGGYGGGGGGGGYLSTALAGHGGDGGFGGGAGVGPYLGLWIPVPVGKPGVFGGLGGGAGVGGAVCIESGAVSIVNTTLSGNGAEGGNSGASAVGGAIYVGKRTTTFTIAGSLLSDNHALNTRYDDPGSAFGGAIYVDGGAILITNTTVQGNYLETAPIYQSFDPFVVGAALGAGVYVRDGVVTIANSTLAGNSLKSGDGGSLVGVGPNPPVYPPGAAKGAGLYVESGSVSMANNTFSSNTVQAGNGGNFSYGLFDYRRRGGDALGAGVYVATGIVTAVNCTITANQALGGPGYDSASTAGAPGAGFGGGIANSNGIVRLLNTIIAGNTAGSATNSLADVSGTFQSAGFNLIGLTNGASGFVPTDLVNSWPALGPLQFNGGPTFTHALLRGSPAIDAGPANGAPSIDQRGFPRPAGRGFDIGAYEYRSAEVRAHVENGRVQLLFVTEPFLSYSILSTTDFLAWQTIASPPGSTNGQFVLEEAVQLSPRFYRAVLPP